MKPNEELSIGEIASRTGLAVSAIRFHETQGLVMPLRNASGQRRFRKSDIRRLSFVLIAQRLGFSIKEIRERLEFLPRDRAPTRRDWMRISRHFRQILDQRIDDLTSMRDRLDGCIGCGCLSLERCKLYNPDDRAARHGPGPRYLLGDLPD